MKPLTTSLRIALAGCAALLDAGLRFGYRHTLFSVNATNIADKRYVATCTGLTSCYYGYARKDRKDRKGMRIW